MARVSAVCGLPTTTDLVEVPTLPSRARGLPPRVRGEFNALLAVRRGAVVAVGVGCGGERLGRLLAGVAEAQVAPGRSSLAEYRLRQGLSREDAVALMRALAFENGVEVLFTAEELAECEAGRRAVPAKLVDALCQVYRIPPMLLIGGQDGGGP